MIQPLTIVMDHLTIVEYIGTGHLPALAFIRDYAYLDFPVIQGQSYVPYAIRILAQHSSCCIPYFFIMISYSGKQQCICVRYRCLCA